MGLETLKLLTILQRRPVLHEVYVCGGVPVWVCMCLYEYGCQDLFFHKFIKNLMAETCPLISPSVGCVCHGFLKVGASWWVGWS